MVYAHRTIKYLILRYSFYTGWLYVHKILWSFRIAWEQIYAQNVSFQIYIKNPVNSEKWRLQREAPISDDATRTVNTLFEYQDSFKVCLEIITN